MMGIWEHRHQYIRSNKSFMFIGYNTSSALLLLILSCTRIVRALHNCSSQVYIQALSFARFMLTLLYRHKHVNRYDVIWLAAQFAAARACTADSAEASHGLWEAVEGERRRREGAEAELEALRIVLIQTKQECLHLQVGSNHNHNHNNEQAITN
jgi:hypothetical protein